MLIWLAMFIIIVWGLISGWLAHAVHKMWAGTVLLPGFMSDLPTLKRIYRWFGIFLVLLACGMWIAALLQRFHHATPSNHALEPTPDRLGNSLSMISSLHSVATLALVRRGSALSVRRRHTVYVLSAPEETDTVGIRGPCRFQFDTLSGSRSHRAGVRSSSTREQA